MDIASLGGVVLGVVCILLGCMLQTNWNIPLFLDLFVDPASIFIVVGGTIASSLLHYPLPQVLSIIPITKNIFTTSTETPNAAIETLVSLAEKARREGLLSLEQDVDTEENEFLKKGIQLVIDGTDPELVREIMEIELEYLEERHKVGVGLYEAMGYYAPAFGMIGTLIGLIAMLNFLGQNAAFLAMYLKTALVTTLYGAIMANLFFLPIAGKLKVRSSEELMLKQVMIQGIICIQEGNNPRIVRQKLMSFLPPKIRREMEAAEGAGGERRAA